MVGEACKSLGYNPFPAPFGGASTPYTNIYGVTLGGCEYCGFCGRTACEANAKASTTTNIMPALRGDPKFELRTRAFVSKLIYDRAAKRVTGVLYTDMKTGEEFEQPAGLVVLSAYVFGNTQLLIYSGIGEPYDGRTGRGLVGKNYCYQYEAQATAFFENKELNPYMGSPGGAMICTISTARTSTIRAWGSLAAAMSAAAVAPRHRSAVAMFRPARRPGAPSGSRRP